MSREGGSDKRAGESEQDKERREGWIGVIARDIQEGSESAKGE
jgi:hypothetical protein